MRRHSGGLALQGALLALSFVAARLVLETEGLEVSAGQASLYGGGALIAIVVASLGPVACLAAAAALSVVTPIPPLSAGGGVDLTAADVFAMLAIGWWLLRALGLSRRFEHPATPSPLPATPVVLFIGFAGLTLIYVWMVDPGRLSVSLVSWLRVVETVILGWLAAEFVRTRRDVSVLLGALALTAVVALVLALVGAAGSDSPAVLGQRGGGMVNPNMLGLVSGMLLLLACFPALTPVLRYRVALGLAGVVGLVQSQSVGSIVGTSVALILGLALYRASPSRRATGARGARAVVALTASLAVAFAVAAAVRPENLPTSDEFTHNSAGQRTIVGAAGLEVAAKHLVIGAGWRRSDEPQVIGDPEVTTALRARFRDTREEFFPDVTPTSVHNSYVQVVADLGVIGLALFLAMLWSLGMGMKRLIARVERHTPEWHQLWFLAWGFVLTLVWLNDNPLYGGQAETVALALFVGAAAGLGKGILAARQAPRALE